MAGFPAIAGGGRAGSAAGGHAPPAAPRATSNALWAWFTGGNALTRIGVVVLFFGVAFLLRYSPSTSRCRSS